MMHQQSMPATMSPKSAIVQAHGHAGCETRAQARAI